MAVYVDFKLTGSFSGNDLCQENEPLEFPTNERQFMPKATVASFVQLRLLETAVLPDLPSGGLSMALKFSLVTDASAPCRVGRGEELQFEWNVESSRSRPPK